MNTPNYCFQLTLQSLRSFRATEGGGWVFLSWNRSLRPLLLAEIPTVGANGTAGSNTCQAGRLEARRRNSRP